MVTKYKNQVVGTPAGVGVPTGGTRGQALVKRSAADFDAGWMEPLTIYSAEEVRVGTWLDGKPIYRVSIDGVAFGDTVAAGVDKIINVYGTVYNPSTGYTYAITDASGNAALALMNKDGAITLTGTAGWGAYTERVITLEYTKTED